MVGAVTLVVPGLFRNTRYGDQVLSLPEVSRGETGLRKPESMPEEAGPW